MKDFPKLILRDVVAKNNKFQFCKDYLKLNNNEEIERLSVTHNGAVVVLAITSKKEIILLDQFRYVLNKRILEFPAGTLEIDETPIECAKRELAEETGFFPKKVIPLGSFYTAPGFCNEVLHSFVAKQLVASEMVPEDEEDIRCLFLKADEIEKLIINQEICDAKTIVTFYRAKLAGLI